MARLCTNINAISVPITIAARNACRAMRSVMPSAASSVGQSLASLAAISLGFGKRKIGTLKLRQAISHITTATTPTAKGAATVMKASDWASGRTAHSLLSAHLLHGGFGG